MVESKCVVAKKLEGQAKGMWGKFACKAKLTQEQYEEKLRQTPTKYKRKFPAKRKHLKYRSSATLLRETNGPIAHHIHTALVSPAVQPQQLYAWTQRSLPPPTFPRSKSIGIPLRNQRR